MRLTVMTIMLLVGPELETWAGDELPGWARAEHRIYLRYHALVCGRQVPQAGNWLAGPDGYNLRDFAGYSARDQPGRVKWRQEEYRKLTEQVPGMDIRHEIWKQYRPGCRGKD